MHRYPLARLRRTLVSRGAGARRLAHRTRWRALAALALLLAPLLLLPFPRPDPVAPAAAATVPVGGAPPPGSGTVVSSAQVQVLDGNTFVTWIYGQQTAVRLVGIDVPQGNTSCGQAATGALWGLVKGGKLTLEEDRVAFGFDARGLRLYHAVDKAGKALSQELVKAGVAKVNGKAEGRHLFPAEEVQAKRSAQGCVWKAGATAGVVDPAGTVAGGDPAATFRAAPRPPSAAAASPLDPTMGGSSSPPSTVSSGCARGARPSCPRR
jgi:endonuclease YncB( thermonuclease family)